MCGMRYSLEPVLLYVVVVDVDDITFLPPPSLQLV